MTGLVTAASNGDTDGVMRELAKPGIDVNAVDSNNFTPFNCSCWYGHVPVVKILLNDPRVDVNKPGKILETPLFCAVQKRNIEVIKLLLADPRVQVNFRKNDGATALFYAAQEGYEAEVVLLLKHPEIDPTIPIKTSERTPFEQACLFYKLEVIKIFVAMCKPQQLKFIPENRIRDESIKSFFAKYHQAPRRTVTDLRRELRLDDPNPAELFSIIIFGCEGLVEVKSSAQKETRFFKIAQSLPIELQMILCGAVFGKRTNPIPLAQREDAFRVLVEDLARM